MRIDGRIALAGAEFVVVVVGRNVFEAVRLVRQRARPFRWLGVELPASGNRGGFAGGHHRRHQPRCHGRFQQCAPVEERALGSDLGRFDSRVGLRAHRDHRLLNLDLRTFRAAQSRADRATPPATCAGA